MIPLKQRSLPKMPSNKYIKIFLFILSVFAPPSTAYDTTRTLKASEVPQELKGINITEKMGEFIDLDLEFSNEKGEKVKIGRYFNQNKPVLFTIIYYKCPNLCQLHLNGLMQGMKDLDITDDFEFIALSMDHSETPDLAQTKKTNYVKQYKLPTPENLHFLTGQEKPIKKISRQVGFKFRWNEEQKQFAHLPVAYVLTPAGQISRYLYGVEMKTKTLKLSLVEASQGRIGGLIERILLFCFQFDPRKNRYTIYAYNIMRAGGILTVFLILGLLIPAWVRIKRQGKP